jgi:hypothetical protein
MGLSDVNVTLEDLSNGSSLATSTEEYTLCMEFTKGLSGTVCFGDQFTDNGGIDNVSVNCTVSYNGVECNNCTVPLCRVADCSNAVTTTDGDNDGMFDTCQGTGTPGLFEIVQLFDNAEMFGNAEDVAAAGLPPEAR